VGGSSKRAICATGRMEQSIENKGGGDRCHGGLVTAGPAKASKRDKQVGKNRYHRLQTPRRRTDVAKSPLQGDRPSKVHNLEISTLPKKREPSGSVPGTGKPEKEKGTNLYPKNKQGQSWFRRKKRMGCGGTRTVQTDRTYTTASRGNRGIAFAAEGCRGK